MDSPDSEADTDPDLFFDALDFLPAAPPPDEKSPDGFRRRRSSAHRDRRNKALPPSQDRSVGTSTSTLTSDLAPDTSTTSEAACLEESSPSIAADLSSPSLLVLIAGFVIKSVLFQLNLLIMLLKIPFWIAYFPFLFATNPFGTLKLGINSIKSSLIWVPKALMEKVSSFLCEELGCDHGLVKLAARLVWLCLWASYVAFVLFGLLVLAVIGGTVMVRRVVEEPIRLTRELSFDYSKATPDALVPLPFCGGVEMDGAGMGVSKRLVPKNHRLNLVISLTLPESDYNRKLGIFQVKAEFLSANGKVTSTSSRPCMLHFKSPHIRLLETFIKSGTLLAGYSSESQMLRLKMTGFVEGIEPTVCIRIILEQRAEYKPNAGIPEVYSASLKIESELPLLKRILWSWKRTVFIWIAMGLYMLELLIVFICCRPIIIPRIGLHGDSSNRT